MSRRAIVIAVVLVAMAILHQDFWQWKDARLVFGFLPVGLAYHAAFSLDSALLMWMLVRYAWPSHLEHVEPEHPGPANANSSTTERP